MADRRHTGIVIEQSEYTRAPGRDKIGLSTHNGGITREITIMRFREAGAPCPRRVVGMGTGGQRGHLGHRGSWGVETEIRTGEEN